MCMAMFTAASAGLLDAHVPFDQPPNLTFGIPALHHSLDELSVLLFGIPVFLRSKRDDGQQILHLREYPLLDHFPDLLVAGPVRILAVIVGPRAQREFDDLVAEVLRV